MDSILTRDYCTDEGVFYASHSEEGRTIDSNKNNALKIKAQQSQHRPITGQEGYRISRLENRHMKVDFTPGNISGTYFC
jgi:hypothetical protein